MDLASAIVGHLVGDYLLQNDWLASNKKQPGRSGDLACNLHCAIWTACVCLFGGCRFPEAWWVVPVLFLAHFAQDRTNLVCWWMRQVGQEGFALGPYAPWSVVVVDNVWHIVVIYAVCRFA